MRLPPRLATRFSNFLEPPELPLAFSSLFALLDDIATLLDDVAVLTKVAAKKTAGVLGDDLALNANQVTGVRVDRELPVVWAVAKGSLVNKAILVPLALLISAVLPVAVTPLLMIGGAYLCFEGAEKVLHKLVGDAHADEEHQTELVKKLADPDADVEAFEADKIKGAIRTDFILSAEIVVISLGTLSAVSFPMRVAVLVAIALLMTLGVYGLVAAIVKLDDLGVRLQESDSDTAKMAGGAILWLAPWLMRALSFAGTVAMFLVGGGIVLHGVGPAQHFVDGLAASAGPLSSLVPSIGGGLFGFAVGAALVGLLSIVNRLRKGARAALSRMADDWEGLSLEARRQQNRDAEARPKCARCERPKVGCYCAHLVEITTKTKVLLLQHPREQDVAIGTAKMASLCLPNAELHVVTGVEEGSPLGQALSDPERPAILLYPGEDAIDVTAHPPTGPVTLVVVDGTWSQTKKMVRKSPTLAALPRYAFVPPRPSEYRIRKEPTDTHVATIEALVHVLTALEGNSEADRARFEALLPPFRAMIDFQIACQKNLAGARKKKPKKRVDRRILAIPGWLRGEARLDDLVCVVAEANALPYHDRPAPESAGGRGYEDEIVQWAACRPSTGEVFARVIKPRRSLGPNTTAYTRLDEQTLLSGAPLDQVFDEWRAFCRPDDVLCSWGRYETSLFARAGGELPQNRIDLRQVARDLSGGKVGTLEGFVAGLGAEDYPKTDHESPLPTTCAGIADVPGRAHGKLEGVLVVLGRILAMGREL